MLKILGASSSGYYDYKKRTISATAIKKKEISQKIIEVYNQSRQIYGASKITVGNYMREIGFKAIWISPYRRKTIDLDFDTKLNNILDRHFNPKKPKVV